MKRLILLYIFVCSIITVNAQTVVLEHEGASTIYTGQNALSNAYNAAESNDILYLSGGTYPSITFNKTISVFGAGFHPDATSVTSKTYFSTNVSIDANATGFKIEGVEVNGSINSTAEGVVIRSCKMNGCSLNGDNSSLINNVILGAITSNSTFSNFFISNNIIIGGIQGIVYSTISNNVIRGVVGSYSANRRYILGDNNNITNNICCDATESYIYDVVTGSNNNIRYNVCWHSNIANANAGNITANNTMLNEATRASLFVDVPTDRTWRWTDDYHLGTEYMGDDNTPVGIYGGAYPMRDFFLPSNPHIVSNNSSFKSDSEGMLNLNITYKAQ